MNDLLTYRGKDSPFVVPLGNRLSFSATPARYALKLENVLFRQDKARWNALTATELRRAAEAAEHLVRRSDAPAPDFVITDGRVKLARDDEPDSGAFGRATDAFPPGYTPDGQLAIALLRIPWSIHVVDATYILVRGDKGWTIRLRQFVYYL